MRPRVTALHGENSGDYTATRILEREHDYGTTQPTSLRAREDMGRPDPIHGVSPREPTETATCIRKLPLTADVVWDSGLPHTCADNIATDTGYYKGHTVLQVCYRNGGKTDEVSQV